MRKNYFKVLGLGCLMMAIIPNTQAQMTPEEAVERMGRGINMGNTLDAPTEGEWAPAAQDHYFKGYKDAGFTSLRIPITWGEHTATTAPYDVDAVFMDRVEYLVDLALDNELLVIMNMHHEEWLKGDYNEDNLARFKAVWTQIVGRFHMKSDSLLFEALNEPQGMTRIEADEANAEALAIIRASNPTRKVIISGNGWSAIQNLEAMAVPDDDYIIGYYHSYDPYPFGLEGDGSFGTESDISAVKATFQRAADWSEEKGVPVIISEFGVRVEADYNSRMRHYATYVETALDLGLAFQVWDDYGWFKVYDRNEGETGAWDEVKDILIHHSVTAPSNVIFELDDTTEGQAILTWDDRSTSGNDFIVQAKNGDVFEDVTTVPNGTTSYTVTGIEEGVEYIYRVVQGTGDEMEMSYPQKIKVVVVAEFRSFYNDAAIAIPGILQPEEYDIWGQDLSYNDSDDINSGAALRQDGVDIELRADGEYQVGYVEVGEWIEISVEVATAGTYQVEALLASQDGGGMVTLSSDAGGTALTLTAPSTSSWETLSSATGLIDLEAGLQVLRLNIDATPAFNMERFIFTESILSIKDPIHEAPFIVSPNPSNGTFGIVVNADVSEMKIQVMNISGQEVKTMLISNTQKTIDLSNQPNGLYLVKYSYKGELKSFTLVKQ